MNKDDLTAKLAKATLDDMARPMSNKDDVAGLVERLRRHKWVSGFAVRHHTICDEAADALTTLSAERDDLQRRLDNVCMNIHTCSGDDCERPVCVERRKGDKLRKALHFYADYHPQPSEGPWGADSRDYGDIARQALAGDTNHG